MLYNWQYCAVTKAGTSSHAMQQLRWQHYEHKQCNTAQHMQHTCMQLHLGMRDVANQTRTHILQTLLPGDCRQQQLVQAEDGCCQSLGDIHVQQGHQGPCCVWGCVWSVHRLQSASWRRALCNGNVHQVRRVPMCTPQSVSVEVFSTTT